jgi:2-polyprenyl-3-methyl-5-hydroxy-6-metoxy-1,4-benzoquinol methylase
MLQSNQKNSERFTASGRDILSNYAGAYSSGVGIPQMTDIEEVNGYIKLVRKPVGSSVLDIGTAEGSLAFGLYERGYVVTAVDISAPHLEEVKKQAGIRKCSLDLEVVDVETDIGALKGRTFDTLFFLDVIEHLRTPIKGLINIRTLMHESSELIINTPNITSAITFFRYLRKSARKIPRLSESDIHALHLSGYDFFTLQTLLAFSGLQIIELIPQHLSLPVLWRLKLYRAVGRFLARLFPYFSDNLLVRCIKSEPIDAEKAVAMMRKSVH